MFHVVRVQLDRDTGVIEHVGTYHDETRSAGSIASGIPIFCEMRRTAHTHETAVNVSCAGSLLGRRWCCAWTRRAVACTPGTRRSVAQCTCDVDAAAGCTARVIYLTQQCAPLAAQTSCRPRLVTSLVRSIPSRAAGQSLPRWQRLCRCVD